LISLLNISKRFGGAVALDDVSLTLGPGERVGLVGENGAGKSSLMNVLYGLYQPDSGKVQFDGQAVVLESPREALARGVGMVQQHFTLVPTLSVAENVVLGAEPVRRGLLDVERACEDVNQTCARFGFKLDPRARVDSLTVGSQQKVEIVKALHRGATTLILDEPTAVLTPQEATELFAVTRALSESGKTVVLISHKLREVLAFATRIAVMRRGRKVADDLKPAETSPEALAAMMVGTEATRAPPPPKSPGPTEIRTPADVERLEALAARIGTGLLESAVARRNPTGTVVLSLTDVHGPKLHGVTLEVRAGEIVGLAGVDGNGQRELAEVVTGLTPWIRGSITLAGVALTALTPKRARALGVAHIPEDRHLRAMVGDFTVEENVALGRQQLAPFARGPFIDFEGRRARTTAVLEGFDVRPREPRKRMAELSGGNQQKLVVGRELDALPKLLVVVQPTRGLDIAAVEAVRTHLRGACDAGCAVLLISLDLDEVLALADRVLVMFEGRLNGEFARGAVEELELGRRMLGAGRESA
jgi:simple sugar transport system ATP-binding protein